MPISAVIIGGGRIALSHLPQIMSSKNMYVGAIVEPSLSSRILLRLLTRCRVYKSIDTIDLSDFDVAYILTPPASHFHIAQTCLNNGVSCFIEKPMTISGERTAKLSSLAREKGLHLQVGYVYRYHPIFKELMKIVREESFGKVKTLSVEFFGRIEKGGDNSWRNKGVASGCIIDYGSHAIDLVCAVLGDITLVSVDTILKEPATGVVDAFDATLTSQNDVSINVKCNWRMRNYRKATLKATVVFEDGTTITASTDNTILKNGEKLFGLSNLVTDVPFYLRGEEFANQQIELERAVRSLGSFDCHGEKVFSQNICVDTVIEEILEHA